MTRVPHTLELIFDKPYVLMNKNKQVILRTVIQLLRTYSHISVKMTFFEEEKITFVGSAMIFYQRNNKISKKLNPVRAKATFYAS